MRKALLLAVVAVVVLIASPARAQFCPGAAPWVFDDVPANDLFCGYITWAAQNGITLGCAVIDANHRLYCPNDGVTRSQMAAFVNRLGNVRVEAVGTGPGLTGGPITSVGTINLATTQLLPTTACAGGQVPQWNGSAWACATIAGGGGTVTSVASGTGLTGGPITSTGTLSIATAYQLPQSCTNGQVPKSNGTGGWTCASDAIGTGTVTSITAGAGLTGGTITGAGTITADTSYVQARVSATCPAGSSIRAIAQNGTVTCQTDNAGPANAFVLGGNAFGGTAVLGTTDNNAIDLVANGTRVMRYEPSGFSPNVVAGWGENTAGPTVGGGVIGGGGMTGSCSGPGGGNVPCANRVTGGFSVVAGGYANQATHHAVVGGGHANYATGVAATIAGGLGNLATGTGATIGGGGTDDGTSTGNVAAGVTSTIAGGKANGIAADGSYGAIGGGIGNQISAPAGANLAIATIGGGSNNLITRGGATIAGGNGNKASNFDAAVGGGNQNQANGSAATVPGGLLNAATGDYSFAAGRRAKAVNRGCFAWGDSTDADMLCNVDDRFVVRASGGVYLYTAPGVTAGAFLAAGSGTWSSVSDRDAKANVAPVDARWVLERVATLPIGTWNYRTQDAGIRHLGPMAQDFRAAFGVGENDTTIATVDADGVALAAIQGLNAKVEAQAREIAELKAAHAAEIAEMQRAIQVLMARTSPEGRVASR